MEWGRVSGDLQGGSNSVSQVDGVSDMAPAAGSSWGVWGVRKGTMASACLDASDFSSSLYATGAFQTTPVLETRGSKSE